MQTPDLHPWQGRRPSGSVLSSLPPRAPRRTPSQEESPLKPRLAGGRGVGGGRPWADTDPGASSGVALGAASAAAASWARAPAPRAPGPSRRSGSPLGVQTETTAPGAPHPDTSRPLLGAAGAPAVPLSGAAEPPGPRWAPREAAASSPRPAGESEAPRFPEPELTPRPGAQGHRRFALGRLSVSPPLPLLRAEACVPPGRRPLWRPGSNVRAGREQPTGTWLRVRAARLSCWWLLCRRSS